MASHPPSSDWLTEFEQSLEQQRYDLVELESRWQSVREAWEQRPLLRESLARARASRAEQVRLRELKQQLAELEVTLESRLISGLTVRMTIWNILRFGSLGFLLGWWLHR